MTLLRRIFAGSSGSAERARLVIYYIVIAAAHVVGWGAVIWMSFRQPALIGLGALAYGFGIRHAFDADHISAIDNVTRKLLHSGQDAVGTGFFFSLGHSTVVFLVATIISIFSHDAVASISARSADLAKIGNVLGTGISGLCLLVIGLLNLLILVDLYRGWRRTHGPRKSDGESDAPNEGANPGGLLFRLFGKIFRFVKSGRQMYFVGFLFGLGFDTASEIALLAISAGVASQGMSLMAALSLPILFAAGMALMDTTDAVMMSKAYSWSLSDPRRRSSYNLVMTGLSVAVALTVGVVELLRLVNPLSAIGGSMASVFAHVSSWTIGITIVAFFAVFWGITVLIQRHRNAT